MSRKHDTGYLSEMATPSDEFRQYCIPYLARKFFPSKETRVVDIGAAWGHDLIPLKTEGYTNLTALDVSDTAKASLTREGITFFQVDAEKDRFPFDDSSVPVFLCFHLVEHLYEVHNLLSEVKRCLTKNGLFFVVTPNWRKQYKTFWADHTHRHPYDVESLPRLLRCYDFKIIWLKGLGAIRGVGRLGLWKIWKPLMFTGKDLIAVASKSDPHEI